MKVRNGIRGSIRPSWILVMTVLTACLAGCALEGASEQDISDPSLASETQEARTNAATLTLAPAAGSSSNFGSVLLGASSTQTFVATNAGRTASGSISIALSGADFSVVTGGAGRCVNGTKLAGGARCTIAVRFAPSTAGAHHATLSVSANPGGAVSLSLTGSGASPATLALSPTSANFGSVLVGASSAPTTFTVSNLGQTATGAMAVSPGGATDFALVSSTCTGVSLAGAATCTIVVNFRPLVRGARQSTLTVSATPGGTTIAALVGSGV